MRVYGFPIPPLLIGLILVPMAETQLRTALAAGQGRLSVLVETPISITFLLLAFLFLFVPVLLKRLKLGRSEEHTSELQSLMRISYAVFCLKKKTNKIVTM